MRFDPRNPHYRNNDRFILSKGHAAPLLYAVWAELGAFPVEDLNKLRRIDSDLEGHPRRGCRLSTLRRGRSDKD